MLEAGRSSDTLTKAHIAKENLILPHIQVAVSVGSPPLVLSLSGKARRFTPERHPLPKLSSRRLEVSELFCTVSRCLSRILRILY